MTKRVFIIAGELSGDQLGGALMERLSKKDVIFEGVGGPSMAKAGLKSRFDMSELSLMGLVEIIPNIPRLLRRVRQTADAIIENPPDAIITIDSPDFCKRVLRRVRQVKPSIKVIHYVAPSVWAWRPERAKKLAQYVDHVLALLPFEPPLMEAAGMSCDFVGHPVTAQDQATKTAQHTLRKRLKIDPRARVLLCLPGSRKGELKKLGPIYRPVLQSLLADRDDLHVILPVADGLHAQVDDHFGDLGSRIHLLPATRGSDEKRAAFATADLALATSGTVALELAAQGCPMVVGYRANRATERMVQKLALIDTANLINILTESRIVPEHLFEACNPEQLLTSINLLLDDDGARNAQKEALDQAMQLLGRGQKGRADWAANSVWEQLKT